MSRFVHDIVGRRPGRLDRGWARLVGLGAALVGAVRAEPRGRAGP